MNVSLSNNVYKFRIEEMRELGDVEDETMTLHQDVMIEDKEAETLVAVTSVIETAALPPGTMIAEMMIVLDLGDLLVMVLLVVMPDHGDVEVVEENQETLEIVEETGLYCAVKILTCFLSSFSRPPPRDDGPSDWRRGGPPQRDGGQRDDDRDRPRYDDRRGGPRDDDRRRQERPAAGEPDDGWTKVNKR